ncbi:hypothetical protein NPIL_2201 [Nephila pilipes]|uniref:Uncharacterized protein n=1 Tax=Nephila pilipes TaxID=299642 RepID=A0A8X6QEW4_NEPPI|nr:hypothetical protein NPIL_2201 [Nephila pilipes]
MDAINKRRFSVHGYHMVAFAHVDNMSARTLMAVWVDGVVSATTFGNVNNWRSDMFGRRESWRGDIVTALAAVREITTAEPAGIEQHNAVSARHTRAVAGQTTGMFTGALSVADAQRMNDM